MQPQVLRATAIPLAVFVAAYVGDVQLGSAPGPALRGTAILFAGALLVELLIAILGTGLSALDSEGRGFFRGFGSPGEIGKLLLTRYLLVFEVASFLLLVAAVGAVILARRREGLEPAGTVSVGDLFRGDPGGTGTLTEAETGSQLEAGGPAHR